MMYIIAFDFPDLNEVLEGVNVKIIHIPGDLTQANINKYLNTDYIILNKINSLAFGSIDLPYSIVPALNKIDLTRITVTMGEIRPDFASYEKQKIITYMKSSVDSVIEKAEKMRVKIDLNKIDFSKPLDCDVFIDLGNRYVKLYNRGEYLDETDLRLRKRIKGFTDNIFFIDVKKSGIVNLIARHNSIISRHRNAL